jgi:hypothetical protein
MFTIGATDALVTHLNGGICVCKRSLCLDLARLRLFEWNDDVVVILEQIRDVCLSPGKDTE